MSKQQALEILAGLVEPSAPAPVKAVSRQIPPDVRRKIASLRRRKLKKPSVNLGLLRDHFETDEVKRHRAVMLAVETSATKRKQAMADYTSAVSRLRKANKSYDWVLENYGQILSSFMVQSPPTTLPSLFWSIGEHEEGYKGLTIDGRIKGWLKGAEAFAGGGLFDLALTLEGIAVLEVCELDEAAVATLNLNMQSRAVPTNALEWTPSIPKGGLDVLAGGPPCQPFSKGRALGGGGGGMLPTGPGDPRNMYPRILEWIADATPRVVVMENSSQISTKPEYKKYIDKWFQQLAHLGYEGTVYSLSSASFGTPQNRERAFVVCWPVGASWGKALLQPPKPTHGDPRSEAVKQGRLLPWTRAFDRLNAGCCAGYGLTSCGFLNNLSGACSFCVMGRNYEPAANQSPNEIRADLNKKDIVRSSAQKNEGRVGNPRIRSFRPVPANVAEAWRELKTDDRSLMRYLSPVIRAGAARSGPPSGLLEPDGATKWGDVDRYNQRSIQKYVSQLKKMSIRDAAKLQDVPQWYVFAGDDYKKIYSQIGNGIPVNLGRAIARHVVHALRGSQPVFAPVPAGVEPESTVPYETFQEGLWPMERVDGCVGTNFIGYYQGWMGEPLHRQITEQQRTARPIPSLEAWEESQASRGAVLDYWKWGQIPPEQMPPGVSMESGWVDLGDSLTYEHDWSWMPRSQMDVPPGFEDLTYFEQYLQGLDAGVYNHYAKLYGWQLEVEEGQIPFHPDSPFAKRRASERQPERQRGARMTMQQALQILSKMVAK